MVCRSWEATFQMQYCWGLQKEMVKAGPRKENVWEDDRQQVSGKGSNVYVLCAEPKEHKHFRPGARPGGSVTEVTEKMFMCRMFMCLFWAAKVDRRVKFVGQDGQLTRNSSDMSTQQKKQAAAGRSLGTTCAHCSQGERPPKIRKKSSQEQSSWELLALLPLKRQRK